MCNERKGEANGEGFKKDFPQRIQTISRGFYPFNRNSKKFAHTFLEAKTQQDFEIIVKKFKPLERRVHESR
jgi:hypothetical protein